MSVKKKGNVWTFRVYVGKNLATGKRRQIYRGGFRTKKAAELAKAEFIAQVKKNGYFTPNHEKFDVFINNWLETVYKNEVQPTTFERTTSIVNHHLLPAFAITQVSNIKTFDVQQFLANKISEGLSPSYIKIMRNILSKAFQTAIDWELTNKNPMERVKGPSIERKKKDVWSIEEVKKFLNQCDDLRWKIAFLIALHTGMRRGEILALKWKNVDFDKQSIKVKETLAYTKELGLFFKAPKTATSVREVIVSDILLDLLKELKLEQEKLEFRMGTSYHPYDLLISTIDGKPIHPRNLVRKFKQLIQKAELKEIAFHDLRHTNATLLMKQGVNPKIVSERLGHANVGITLDIYSHVDLEMQRESVIKLQEILS